MQPSEGTEKSLEDETWLDPDIASMELSYPEKSGLQVYRNYTRAFEKHAIKVFIDTIDSEPIELDDLRRLFDQIRTEDPRFLPVIVCAFADDVLKDTFKRTLPDGIPGGRSGMLGGYGALSDLAKRIQLAYAFDVLSSDLMLEFDRLRGVRNKISHSWTVPDLENLLKTSPLNQMHRMEAMLTLPRQLSNEFGQGRKLITAFRLRLVWVTARLVYESAAYARAKAAKLQPIKALYDAEAKPIWLRQIATLASDATREIAKRDLG